MIAGRSWLMAALTAPPGVKTAVIPTVTMLAVRHFRDSNPEGEHEPKHSAVKFVLGAWNDGDFSQAYKHIAADCEVYTNGISFASEHGGPAMAKESVEYWRAIAPDLRMELLEEIREKHRIAIGFRMTGTHTEALPELPASGHAIDLEGSAFLTLDGDKIVEVWTVVDALALAVQTGATEAPVWWPGRT